MVEIAVLEKLEVIFVVVEVDVVVDTLLVVPDVSTGSNVDVVSVLVKGVGSFTTVVEVELNLVEVLRLDSGKPVLV